MPDDNQRPLLIAGLGLVGLAGWQLLQKPATPAPPPAATCPAGYHLAGGVCVQDPPPPPPVLDTRPTVTAIEGLLVRAGPSTSYRVVGSLPYGTHVTIACQLMGQTIVRSAVWDQLSGPVAGYVSDWYVSTPNVGSFSPGYSICSGSPVPPVTPPVTPPAPTGKPPLSTLGQLVARMIVSTGCGWGDADYILLARQATATASPRFGRVWIQDKYTWDGLGAPRSAINIVAPGLLAQLGNAGTVRRLIIRNYGEGWTWDGIVLGQTVWDTAMQAVNRGPFAVLKTPAGWCS